MKERICGRCGRPLGKSFGTWVFRVLYCPDCLKAIKAELGR